MINVQTSKMSMMYMIGKLTKCNYNKKNYPVWFLKIQEIQSSQDLLVMSSNS